MPMLPTQNNAEAGEASDGGRRPTVVARYTDPRTTTLRSSNGRDQQHVKPALPSRTLLSNAAQQSLNSEPGCLKVVDTFRVRRYKVTAIWR
jgi:hypothetical protein